MENSDEDKSDKARRDQKLESPCKVVVKRIHTSSVNPINVSDESDDDARKSCSADTKLGEQAEITAIDTEVETDANANVRAKGATGRVKKRASADTFVMDTDVITNSEKRQRKKEPDAGAKKRRGRNSAASREESVNELKKESARVDTHGPPPVGPPVGATQQAASLFRTKASVKIYDPTQTSSPNSSEQSNTPQTPDLSIQTPQTPVTPDPSVNSAVSEGQQSLVHPSPSCSVPSPTTPRTPSTSGMVFI